MYLGNFSLLLLVSPLLVWLPLIYLRNNLMHSSSTMIYAISNILSWVLNNQGNDTKRGVGMALLQMVGQCGPILGTRQYPKIEAPYYIKGMSICAAFMLFNALLALGLRTYLIYLNQKAARAEPSVGQVVRDEKTVQVAVKNDGVGWRNIL